MVLFNVTVKDSLIIGEKRTFRVVKSLFEIVKVIDAGEIISHRSFLALSEAMRISDAVTSTLQEFVEVISAWLGRVGIRIRRLRDTDRAEL